MCRIPSWMNSGIVSASPWMPCAEAALGKANTTTHTSMKTEEGRPRMRGSTITATCEQRCSYCLERAACRRTRARRTALGQRGRDARGKDAGLWHGEPSAAALGDAWPGTHG